MLHVYFSRRKVRFSAVFSCLDYESKFWHLLLTAIDTPLK